jgi:hypothetical protein
VKASNEEGMRKVRARFTKTRSDETYIVDYEVDTQGYKRWEEGIAEEGYFKHRFDDTDGKLHAIIFGAALREEIEQLALAEELDPYTA